MTLTIDQLSSALPNLSSANSTKYLDSINKTLDAYSISSPNEIAMFLAQIGHESGDFTEVVENLNYSAQALLSVFPSHFSSDIVNDYARQPEKIANRVYANRMGNGDESSGDGWTYRGRGAIQITGCDNYTALGNDLNQSDTPSYLESVEGIVMSAGWFWNKHNLNSFTANGDVTGCTKIINGGTIGLQDRISRYNTALAALGDLSS